MGSGCDAVLSLTPRSSLRCHRKPWRHGEGDKQTRCCGDSGEDSPGMGTSWGQRSCGDGACVGMWRFGVLIPLLGGE